MNINKLIKTIGGFFGKYWQKWTILVILVMIVYLGFIAYQYIYKPTYQVEPPISFRLDIKKSVYEAIMNLYSQKQENIIEIFNKNYLDPFK